MNLYVKKNKAFTLIELLVVISIISLLSSVVLSSVNNARSRGRDARRLSDLHQIRNALNLYSLNNNYILPSSGVYTTWLGCGSNDWLNLQTVLSPYISRLPVDPLKGQSAGCPSSERHWYAYLPNFRSGSISAGNGAEGTCLGKTILFLNRTEGSVVRKNDCDFSPSLTSQYPNAVIMVIN
jgi:prepilin-type N-terminal cleavage/methylation domain-containing protein